MPVGFGIAFDRSCDELEPGVLVGGTPARLLRLSSRGHDALRELRGGTVRTAAGATLARRLFDAGLAHPLPPAAEPDSPPPGVRPAVTYGSPVGGLLHPTFRGVRSTVTYSSPFSGRLDARALPPAAEPDLIVVVPAYDRTALLAECLRELGNRFPVLVVDDASTDAEAVAKIAADHGARLVRRQVNGGPAAARNTGLAHVTSALVAFVDSDAVPTAEDLARVAAHLADPAVVAAAPRIVATSNVFAPSSLLGLRSAGDLQSRSQAPKQALSPRSPVRTNGRYGDHLFGRTGCVLDLGERPARVAPFTKVAYVPSTVLVVRRSAVDGFDEDLRYGEDVDLIWRLHAAGHTIRYDPTVRVGHHEPATRRALLERRYRYGTSAASLSKKHPGTFVPLALEPFTAAAVAAVLAGKPRIAAAALGAGVVDEILMRRQIGLPAAGAPKAVAARAARTWRTSGTYATQLAVPVLVVAALARRPTGTALVASALPRLAAWVLAEPLASRRRPFAHLAEDLAYGAGVLAGCVRERTAAPLKPFIRRRPR